MSFEEMALKVIGNIFLVVFVVRGFGAYLKKEWGDLAAEIVFAIILVGLIYFTDGSIAILKWLWNATLGTWFGVQAP